MLLLQGGAQVIRKQVIAAVPLLVLDLIILLWIFISLRQTLRTLRIREDLVKLSQYRYFTTFLIVSLIGEIIRQTS
jgi:hypothetical protein